MRPPSPLPAKAPTWRSTIFPPEQEDADQVIALIEQAGRKGVAIPGDLRRRGFLPQAWWREAVKALGGLDILVNNAARQQSYDSMADISSEEFDATMKTNIYAPFWTIQAGAAASEARLGDHRHDVGTGL